MELFHHLEKNFVELEFMEQIIVYKNNDILKQESIQMSDFKILSNFCEISKKYENDKQKKEFFNYIFKKISDPLRMLISDIIFQVIINQFLKIYILLREKFQKLFSKKNYFKANILQKI